MSGYKVCLSLASCIIVNQQRCHDRCMPSTYGMLLPCHALPCREARRARPTACFQTQAQARFSGRQGRLGHARGLSGMTESRQFRARLRVCSLP